MSSLCMTKQQKLSLFGLHGFSNLDEFYLMIRMSLTNALISTPAVRFCFVDKITFVVVLNMSRSRLIEIICAILHSKRTTT